MNATDNDCDTSNHGGRERWSVLASAPVRTADIGGWTDTWFARHGLVCNIAIDERANVRIDVDPAAPASIELALHMTGERYAFSSATAPGRHPMLEVAASALAPSCGMVVEVGETLDGSGLGTSAAVLVATVAGLRAVRGLAIDPVVVAADAHRFETGSGRQAGVQDHVAAAFGGVSLISVEYPQARRSAVHLSGTTMDELNRRLITVWFGRSHQSSAMHDDVIARSASPQSIAALDRIRDVARLAGVALSRDDVEGYAVALTTNHVALDDLHPDLVFDDARELIEMSRSNGAVGWKSNGAGGPGGSMAVVGPADRDECDALRDAIAGRAPWRCVDALIATQGVSVHRVAEHSVVAHGREDRS